MAHKYAKSQYFRKFFYLHIYQILEKFPTYMIIRNCTFIKLGVIFLPTRLFGHYDYSVQQSKCAENWDGDSTKFDLSNHQKLPTVTQINLR